MGFEKQVTHEVEMPRPTRKVTEILARATAVFGGQKEAKQWLERPAIGLDQRRPIDLLATAAGAKIVEDHLTRLAFGVCA
jgi:putative toxin-antitoxin system antitoxin component (TIGR02293 family)